MRRWVYSYESTGTRALSDAELKEVGRQLAGVRTRTVLRTLLTVCLGLGIFLGIIVATSSAMIGWPMMIAFLIAFLFSLNLANGDHFAWLLYSRARRVGMVEIFRWSEAPPEVRALYAIESLSLSESPTPFWIVEEKLVSKLSRMAGGRPQIIETVAHDGVILRVEGKFASRALTVKVADLDRRTVSDCPVETVAAVRAAATLADEKL